jgi:LysM repeat protein
MAAAIGCLLALQWLPLEVAALGRLAIFLPSQAVVVPQDSIIELPTAVLVVVAEPTNTPRPTVTSAPTPTQEPTATVEPTFTPTPPPTEAPAPPTEAPAPPTEAPAPPTEAPAPTNAPRQVQRYIVESGDTLKSIANQFDVSVEAILRFNGLSEEDGDNLRVGQELFIPPQ